MVSKIIAKSAVKLVGSLYERVAQIGLKNLRSFGENCISGATLERSAENLNKVRQAGIDTIIDFRSEASSAFGQQCKDLGFKYLLFPLEHTRAGLSGVAKNGASGLSDEFVVKLRDFITATNGSKVYMGCNYGIDRTNLGVVLNYLLNPKAVNAPKILTWGDFRTKSVINKTLKTARKMIKKMTPEQKQMFGLGENYNENFQKKIAKLLAVNLYH